MRQTPPYMLHSVDRALVLLHLLRDQGTLTVSEAARSLGVGQSTAHRMLANLVYRDFAHQDDDRSYRPGPALCVPAGPGERVALLRQLLSEHLNEIRDATGETANLAVRVDGHARIVATAVSNKVVHVPDQVGTMLPVQSSAAGKAELAWMSQTEVIDLMTRLGNAAELDTLLDDLVKSRRRGYAINDGVAEDHVSAVGVAIRNPSGAPIGALAVAMPSSRFTREARLDAAAVLNETATKVRRILPRV